MDSSSVAADLDALVERSRGFQPWRRVFHVCCGIVVVIPLALWNPPRSLAVSVLMGVGLLQVTADAVRLKVPRANVLFYQMFPGLVTPRERDRIASSTWFLLGALVSVALFPQRAAIGGILVLALADPAANVVGRRWGRIPFGKDGTLEGTTAFVVVAFLTLLPLAGPLMAAGAAIAASATERLLRIVDDNLLIPVVTGAALWGLGVG